MMDGWDGSDWIWGTLMMLLFWGGLVAVIAFAVRAFTRGSRQNSGGDQPSEAGAILEARFARGEISREEFEERRRVLEAERRGTAAGFGSRV